MPALRVSCPACGAPVVLIYEHNAGSITEIDVRRPCACLVTRESWDRLIRRYCRV